MKQLLIKIIPGLALVVLFVVACKKKDCDVEPEFKLKFNEQLKLLKDFTKGFEADDTKKAVDAANYLNAVTSIQSDIYLGDVVYYEPQAFKRDKKKWLSWYEENKCSMTLQKADSLWQISKKVK